MKATIDFDDALYRRLKIEAARRGRTVRELVAEGVRYVLDTPDVAHAGDQGTPESWRPDWYGSLGRFGRATPDHSLDGVRKSVSRGRENGARG